MLLMIAPLLIDSSVRVILKAAFENTRHAATTPRDRNPNAVVAVAALAAAMIAQHFRAARNELRVRADLNRFTPSEHAGGVGKMALVGDKLVIGFHPAIFGREAPTRSRWRFKLFQFIRRSYPVHRDDREVRAQVGEEHRTLYLQMLGRPPALGEYRGVFFLSLHESVAGKAAAWDENEVHSDAFAVLPQGK